VILFSSGSEGTPKGIMLSHKNLIANVKQVITMLNPSLNDKLVIMVCMSAFLIANFKGCIPVV
jgi:acyl-[acyl-carrier-protein]-phospholipid O-acyltransferase/long-chain-fatty-acid--[acyl-carrier-protein] ligase